MVQATAPVRASQQLSGMQVRVLITPFAKKINDVLNINTVSNMQLCSLLFI